MCKCAGVRGRGQSAGVRGRSLLVQVSETSQSDKYSQSDCTLTPDYLALPPTKWPSNEVSQPSSHWSGTSCALSATHWTVSRVLSPQVPPGAAVHLNWSRSSKHSTHRNKTVSLPSRPGEVVYSGSSMDSCFRDNTRGQTWKPSVERYPQRGTGVVCLVSHEWWAEHFLQGRYITETPEVIC